MATDVCNDLAGMNHEAIFGIFMMAAIQSGIPVVARRLTHLIRCAPTARNTSGGRFHPALVHEYTCG